MKFFAKTDQFPCSYILVSMPQETICLPITFSPFLTQFKGSIASVIRCDPCSFKIKYKNQNYRWLLVPNQPILHEVRIFRPMFPGKTFQKNRRHCRVSYRLSKIHRDWYHARPHTTPSTHYRSELRLGQRGQTLLHAIVVPKVTKKKKIINRKLV